MQGILNISKVGIRSISRGRHAWWPCRGSWQLTRAGGPSARHSLPCEGGRVGPCHSQAVARGPSALRPGVSKCAGEVWDGIGMISNVSKACEGVRDGRVLTHSSSRSEWLRPWLCSEQHV